MEFFIIMMLNGVSYGLLLFMLSSGLTLIFSMMGVLNFAHASFYMLGAYLGYALSIHVGFWAGFFIAPLALFAIGALIERHGLRAVHAHGHVAELLFTFGLAYVIVEVVQVIWGRLTVPYAVPASMDGPLFTLFTTPFPAYRAFMMAVAIVMLAGLYLLLKRTRIGLVVQAALTHPEALEALGHNVPRVFMGVFGGGAALAGLAGVIGGNAFVTEPGMAAGVGSIIFVVVVIGGLGSLVGALLASLAIGILQTSAVSLDYSPLSLLHWLGTDVAGGSGLHDVLGISLAQAAPILPYLFLVLMLVLRPKGLLGTRES